MSEPKRFSIRTFGCQMNVHDTEKLSNLLYHAGRITSYNVCYTKLLRHHPRKRQRFGHQREPASRSGDHGARPGVGRPDRHVQRRDLVLRLLEQQSYNFV